MATLTKLEPPFAWMGRYWTTVGLVGLALLAALFRFYQLGGLPPGLDETSARVGLEALSLSPTHLFPNLNGFDGYAPLWVWLQAASVHVFGHGILALRFWSAIAGFLAVGATWLWIRDWIGPRAAWPAAFLMAVCPWAVTTARSGLGTALITFLVPATLWLGTRAWRAPKLGWWAGLGVVVAADLLSGPLGLLVALAAAGLGIWMMVAHHDLTKFPRPKLVGTGIAAVGLAVLGYLVGVNLSAIKALPSAIGIVSNWTTIGTNIVKVLLMFNVHGDENYRHNLSGEPLLNAFVGLMLVAGLLVSISRLHQHRYQRLIIMLGIFLVPAFVAPNVPNSSWAAAVLPVVFALVGVGTAYMLELWYTTFPVNSAARATGLGAIAILIGLSTLQGYTQYFHAYAGSSAVYTAFNEGTTQLALRLPNDKSKADRFVVAPADQLPVAQYLNYNQPHTQFITTAQLQVLPIAASHRLFYITAASRDEAVTTLKAKFPGGTLEPHYSDFNLVEIYYTYEVGQ
ncbi:MAG TPA: glycosyltransferase family 39 protein [Candidatus Saccharimonadia bacterium]|jgi:4-amino-4-deoxy-L-arabinose transferase-like glycosyltransferase|nr:glycosyltransferase family 39 protein [Candidatus Saccharimonadia bacterium]